MLSFISSDPLSNLPKIWTEYLPNDPFCQQVTKEGRDKAISKYTRCDDCRMNEHAIQDDNEYIILYEDKPCNCYREFRSKPKFKYYGSMEGRMKKLLQKVGDIYLLCCPETETSHHYIGMDTNTLSIISNVKLESIIPEHVRSIERVYRCQDRITTIKHTIKEQDISQSNTSLIRKQLHEIMSKLAQVRFNLGSVTYGTLVVTDNGLLIDHTKNSSFDLNANYRLGPILDDLKVPSVEVFAINRLNNDRVHQQHYFRLNTTYEDGFYSDDVIHTISKYGIPVVGKAIDYYRCFIALMMKSNDPSWISNLFLPSEMKRVTDRINKVHHHIIHHNAPDIDLIHCLYDKEGPFSLRCDAHSIV